MCAIVMWKFRARLMHMSSFMHIAPYREGALSTRGLERMANAPVGPRTAKWCDSAKLGLRPLADLRIKAAMREGELGQSYPLCV